MKNPIVSIIYVNYKTLDVLIPSINSLIQFCTKIEYELIVVDNASNDGARKLINDIFSDSVRYLQLQSNIGFGGANNAAARIAEGKYLFFLNTDTLILNDCLSYFVEFISAKENIGAIGCPLLSVDGVTNTHSSNDLPSFRNEVYFLISLYIKLVFGINLIKEDYANDQVKSRDVGYNTGAAFFITKDVFWSVNGFDEKFFMYYEETDLQRRLLEVNKKNVQIYGPQIIHLEGTSTGGQKNFSLNRLSMVEDSRFRYMRKHNSIYTYIIFRVLYFFLTLPFILDNRISMKDKWNVLRIRSSDIKKK